MLKHLSSFKIFRRGSTTFFFCSLFFPAEVLAKVADFYAFVRTADDLVDIMPPKRRAFEHLRQQLLTAQTQNTLSGNPLVDRYLALEKKYALEPLWIQAFLSSMAQDLTIKSYLTLADTETYMYGSAQVIGLIMAKILNLPSQSYPAAAMLGKTLQYINFIRDLQEDLHLGRCYFPQSDLKRFSLKNLNWDSVIAQPNQFQAFIRFQIKRVRIWQSEAENGFVYLPKKYLIPIKTAFDMYLWTIARIERDPFIVYHLKLKPSRLRILTAALKNLICL